MKVLKITLINYKSFIIISNSMDKAYKDLLDYLDKEDLFFMSERKIKKIEILAKKVDIDDYENIYTINEK